MTDKEKNHCYPVNDVKSKIILASGFIMLLLGVSLILKMCCEDKNADLFGCIVLFALGEADLFYAFCYKKKTFLIAMGFMFVFDGFFYSIINIGLVSLGLRELWPVFVICAAFSLIPADLFVNKRLRTVFLFPAILMFFLGVIFLLFSSGLITISFSRFITIFWPVVLVVVGVALIAIFVFQQLHQKKFPYMQDDSADENSFMEME